MAKFCVGCKKEKEYSEFYKNSKSKDLLTRKCKTCVKLENKTSSEKRKDKKKEYNRLYYSENSTIIKKKARVYGIKNRVDRTKYERFYRANNKFKISIKHNKRRSLEYNADGNYSGEDIELIYKNQNGLCAYCGSELNGIFEVDHIHPLSRGGSNWPSNLACSCRSCNRSKSDKTISEWEMR